MRLVLERKSHQLGVDASHAHLFYLLGCVMSHDWLRAPDCEALHESRHCCMSNFLNLLTMHRRQLEAPHDFCLMVFKKNAFSLHKPFFALLQATTGVAVSMHIYMFKAHAALGEGRHAVALMKDMRGVGLPVPAPACSLLVLAFCKADALQVHHTVNAFTAHLPCHILV